MFSEALITQAKRYFSDKWGREISRDEAENYLYSLAELYLSFVDMDKNASDEIDFSAPQGAGKSIDLS